jgi:hypothetical protein
MWTYNSELYHYGVLGMKWGRRKHKGLREVIGTRKLNEYKKLSKEAIGFANELEKQQHVMDDPKSWQKGPYNESLEGSVKAAKYSKKLTKKYKDAGQKWLETNSAINKMTYKDAKKAKELYKKTSDDVFKSAGYKRI